MANLFCKFLSLLLQTRRVVVRFDLFPGNVSTIQKLETFGEQRNLGQFFDMAFGVNVVMILWQRPVDLGDLCRAPGPLDTMVYCVRLKPGGHTGKRSLVSGLNHSHRISVSSYYL